MPVGCDDRIKALNLPPLTGAFHCYIPAMICAAASRFDLDYLVLKPDQGHECFCI